MGWRVGLVIAGAGLLWASFFPGLGGLSFLALVPMALALMGAGAKRGAALGGLFGLLFFALEFSSLSSLAPFIGSMAYVVVFLIALYGAVYSAAFGALVGWRGSAWAFVGGWVLVEAARASGPLGFTFGSTPVALAGTPFVASASLGGPWLISLGVAWTGAWLAQGLRRPRLLPLALLGPLSLFLLGFTPPLTQPDGELEIALIQPNIAQGDRLDRGKLPLLLEIYEGLLGEVPEGVDLIVVPENALPAFLRLEPEYLTPFLQASAEKNAPLLVGTADIQGEEIRNTMLLVTPDGSLGVAHAKVHLVPFGEYVPGRAIWKMVGLDEVIDQFLPYDQSPGEGFEPWGPVGIMICFESAFPEVSRALVHEGAEVLLTPTNDAWFGRTRLLWEHYALGALRAAETGRVFVQAGQTGVSGAWGPDGRELQRLPPWTRGVFSLTVSLHQGLTPYARVGDLPVLLLAGLILVFGLRKRAHRSGPGKTKEVGRDEG